MRIYSILYKILPIVVVLCARLSWSQEPRHEMVRLADDILVFLSTDRGIGNILAVIGDQGVLVVDSALPSAAAGVIRSIREHTDKPVRYLVNTHWHDDHIWGNQEFTKTFPGVRIIGHLTMRADMLELAVPALAGQIESLEKTIQVRSRMLDEGADENGQPLSEERRVEMSRRQEAFGRVLSDFRQIRPTPPTVLVERRMIVILGETEVQILHLGRGHSQGDLVVYLPSQGVLATGDLLTHPVPAAAGAFPVEWVETLTRLQKLEFSTLIPGHGPIMMDRSYLQLVQDALAAVSNRVRDGVAAGHDLETVKQKLDFSDLKHRFGLSSPALQAGFDRFFLQPAIAGAFATWSRAQNETVP